MGKIEFTNVVIDDFSVARQNPTHRYVHFLTHFHVDHLKGLSDSWDFGVIYCSHVTQRLMLTKFPGLNCLQVLGLQEQHDIKLSSMMEIKVTFFDANHCAGAVMILLEGYMGRVLYTGDIRFQRKVFQNYSYLYPPELRNNTFTGCSKPIDVLYVDNTFMHPVFKFCTKDKALEMAEKFVEEVIIAQLQLDCEEQGGLQERKSNIYNKILIGLDNFGKEEVLVRLAEKFDTYIVVDQIKYELLKALGVDLELFTTKKGQGFIQVVAKRSIETYLADDPNAIGMILTGWANEPHYRNPRLFCVPYSLHSNYSELHSFVNSIRPSILHPIVPQSERQLEERQMDPNGQHFQHSYFMQIKRLKELYTKPVSEQYRELISDPMLQQKIMQRLEIKRAAPVCSSDNSMSLIHAQQTVPRKKYQLSKQRNEQEITRVKNQFLKLKQHRMSINVDEEAIEINDNEVQEESREYVHIEAETIQVDPLNLPFQKVSPEKVDEKTNSRRNNLVKFRETKDSFLEQMEVVTPPTHKISFDLPFKKDKMVDNSETNNPQRRSLPSFLHVDLNNLRHIRLLSTPQSVRDHIFQKESQLWEMLKEIE